MEHSYFNDRLDALPGYNLLFGNAVRLFPARRSWSPSGGLITTAEDMACLVQLYLNNGAPLLEPELAKLALTPPEGVGTDPGSGYGMGWYSAEINGVRYLTHGGDTDNFHANMALLPDAGYGVVVFYNSNNMIANFSVYPALLNGLVLILSGQDAPAPGVSMPTIGLVILMWMLWALAGGVRKLLLTRGWAATARGWKPLRRILALALNLLPAVILLLLPQLVLLVMGRSTGHRLLFAYLPDVLLVLAAASLLGLLQFAARLRALKVLRQQIGRVQQP